MNSKYFPWCPSRCFMRTTYMYVWDVEFVVVVSMRRRMDGQIVEAKH
jgi:hypothetical protein